MLSYVFVRRPSHPSLPRLCRPSAARYHHPQVRPQLLLRRRHRGRHRLLLLLLLLLWLMVWADWRREALLFLL